MSFKRPGYKKILHFSFQLYLKREGKRKKGQCKGNGKWPLTEGLQEEGRLRSAGGSLVPPGPGRFRHARITRSASSPRTPAESQVVSAGNEVKCLENSTKANADGENTRSLSGRPVRPRLSAPQPLQPYCVCSRSSPVPPVLPHVVLYLVSNRSSTQQIRGSASCVPDTALRTECSLMNGTGVWHLQDL